jgi:hypothetical protein
MTVSRLWRRDGIPRYNIETRLIADGGASSCEPARRRTGGSGVAGAPPSSTSGRATRVQLFDWVARVPRAGFGVSLKQSFKKSAMTGRHRQHARSEPDGRSVRYPEPP